MKMKKIFTKTLLLAALLAAGVSSAWAQTTTLLEYGTNDVAWTAENLADWTAGGNPTIKEGGYVEITGGNGSYETSKAIAPTANAIINVQAVWRGRSNTGRAFSAGNGSYFRFGNIIIAHNDQDKKHGYGFTGLANMSSVTTFSAGSYRVDITSCTWLLIEMEINTAENKLTSFTIKSEDGNTTYASATNVALSDADYATVAFGYRKAGSVSTANAEDLKSVKVTQTVQQVETADYIINYLLNGEGDPVKSVNGNIAVGATVATEASFFVEEAKYYRVADEPESFTIASGTNNFTVNVRNAETYNCSLVSSLGGTIATSSGLEGETVTLGYPRYMLSEGKLYEASATNKEYRKPIALTANNASATITYTEKEGANAVFFIEGENVEGMTQSTANNIPVRASNALAAISNEDITITSLPAGKYKFHAGIFTSKSAYAEKFINFGIGTETFAAAYGGVNLNEIDSEEYTLSSTTDIKFLGTTSWGDGQLDYLWIEKTGDYTVSKTITAAGYATFCSPFALNFDGTGLTAYIAKTDGEKDITFKPVTTIPANTGVLLQGDEGNYNIPVIASADAVVGNVFVGTTESTTAPVGSFVLMATPSVGFYKTTNDFTVGANTAYLPASVAPGRSFIWFEESGTTAIQAPVVKNLNAGEIYTISGQRVAKPTKGLYIMNGKKVVVK